VEAVEEELVKVVARAGVMEVVETVVNGHCHCHHLHCRFHLYLQVGEVEAAAEVTAA
jgi:hypothetical protein